MISLEVLKADFLVLEQVGRAVLNADNALNCSRMFKSFRQPLFNARPQQMDVGNIKRNEKYLGKRSRDDLASMQLPVRSNCILPSYSCSVCYKE